ncbi:MAG: NAD(P)/FAD-dependent oxidoreductase [Myxococcales bacterium]|nr:NAD(P)/FAD-dependent oxidoreductase [Myxococcales bacterium]
MTRVGKSFKQQPPAGKFDAIIIGSGIGGLSCAAMLARHGGQRVLVLERHYRAGGFTHTFERPGYEWDVGVHYVGQVGERGGMRHIFDRLTDGRLKWAALPEVYDSIELGSRRYELVAGTRRFVERLGEYFPRRREVLEQYVQLVKSTARQGTQFMMTRALPAPLGRVLGWATGAPFSKLASRTTWDVLRELTDDEELISVLTGQYGDYGLPPRRSSFAIHAAVVAHYLGGGYYPLGGSARFAEALAPVIEEKGGHIALCAEVDRVVLQKGKAVGVRLATGEELFAPRVISDAGVANTFGRLLPEEARPPAWTKALNPSVSYLCLYLGYPQTDAQLGLSGTNLWLYPDGQHDRNVERFEADPEAPFPLVYCSFPSAKDPDFQRRHPGHATIDVITMARWDWFAKWKDRRWRKRGADYEALKERFTRRLLDALEARLPQVKGKAAHVELSTPVTATHFAGHPKGELYGLDHTPARYAVPLRARTPIDGLFLTGADLASCGVAGAVLGGLVTAGAILGPRPVLQLARR